MGKTNNSIKDYFINDEIKLNDDALVRIVGDAVESKVVTFSQAKSIAAECNMDVILLNYGVKPCIVRIDAYDKFMYHLKKNMKKNKQIPKPLKEIDLKVNIASNDLETKVRKAKEFIEDGSKVKVVLTIRGRELSRRGESERCLYDFIKMMADTAVIETEPKSESNKTIVIFKHK